MWTPHGCPLICAQPPHPPMDSIHRPAMRLSTKGITGRGGPWFPRSSIGTSSPPDAEGQRTRTARLCLDVDPRRAGALTQGMGSVSRNTGGDMSTAPSGETPTFARGRSSSATFGMRAQGLRWVGFPCRDSSVDRMSPLLPGCYAGDWGCTGRLPRERGNRYEQRGNRKSMSSVREFYRNPLVRLRIEEFLGARARGVPMADFITRCDRGHYDDVHVDSVEALPHYLDRGLDSARTRRPRPRSRSS